jgi:hypothetical protein
MPPAIASRKPNLTLNLFLLSFSSGRYVETELTQRRGSHAAAFEKIRNRDAHIQSTARIADTNCNRPSQLCNNDFNR